MGLELLTKWTKIEVPNQDIIIPRSSHCITIVNDDLYVLGGENIARTPIDSQIYSLNLNENNTNSWNSIEVSGNLPPSTIAHAQANIGDLIYVFGGRVGIEIGEGPLNDLYSFNIITNTWTGPIEFIGVAPQARSFHKMVGHNDSLFLFGGCAQVGRLNDLHEFNTITNTWTSLPISENISGRGGAGFEAADGKIVVATGYSGIENNDIHIYDIETQIWTTICSTGSEDIYSTDMYRARSVCGTCVLKCKNNNIMVIFGGEVSTSDRGHEGAGDFVNDIVCIDMSNGTIIPNLNTNSSGNL